MERSAPFDLVVAMNDFAQRHGATHTIFTDASGLSDQNVSTVRELSDLFGVLYEQHRHIIDITTLPTYLNHVNAWMNNNPFVDDPAYAGGKHGYTEAANRTAIAQFNEVIDGSTREIVYVLLGSSDLSTDMKILRDFTITAVHVP
jgi:D-alanyl-D-alanine carboxypeptidase